MFNLFKSVMPEGKTATIADVHADFDASTSRIASEASKLITTAKDILQEESIKDEKAIYKLSQMGFWKSKTVKKHNDANHQLIMSQHTAELVKYYSENYPNNKFITLEEVKRLCQKYGLLYSGPEHFIGEIPVKNQREIADFAVKKEDILYFRTEMGGIYGIQWVKRIVDKSEYDLMKKRNSFGMPIQHDAHKYSCGNDIKVVGTPDQFDLKDKQIDGYEVKLKDPDPIVLIEVNGGYLIVSKWGAEENII